MTRASRGILFLTVLLAVEAAAGVLQSPSFVWNEVRLARSAALARGLPIYLGRDDLGPVIGTLHAPVSHCLYLAVAWIPDVTVSIVAGSILSLLLVFAPLAWMLVRVKPAKPESSLVTAAACLFCGFLVIGTQGPYNTVLMIHTDAPALACATVACGIFASPRRAITISQVWISGIACALVIGAKQTLAPLAIALVLFIAIIGSRRLAVHFVIALIASGALLLAVIFAAVPAQAFLFNTVTLAAHRPLKPQPLKMLVEAFRAARNDALPALFPLLFLTFFAWNAYGKKETARQFIRANRWLLFPAAAALLIPTSAKAIITVGGDVNHLGLVLYFLFAGAALAIQQYAVDPRDYLRHTSWFFAIVGIALTIAPGTIVSLNYGLRTWTANATETAYKYELRHPSRAYFPCNPLAALRATGKLYHVEYALYDREIAGYPLSAAQIASGLPSKFELVAVPPGEPIFSKAIGGLLAGFRPNSDPELPGWTVFRREL